MTRYDKILIVSIVVVSLFSIVFISYLGLNPADKKYIVVKVGTKVVKTISTKDNGKEKVYEFYFNGQKGQLQVKGNMVRMLPMDKQICPKQICSRTGWISRPYQTIICLPNKISVTIKSKTNSDIDGVSI